MKKKCKRTRRNMMQTMKPYPGVQRLVACAAIRFGDLIFTSIRHWDVNMRNQVAWLSRNARKYMNTQNEEQGFLDQWGNFMNRKEAMIVAKASGQFGRLRETDNESDELFSEDYV